jgi:hypothetical protein
VSKVFRCNRCREEKPPLGLDHLPSGWREIEDADLCERCVKALHDFLMPLPKCSPPPTEAAHETP